MNHVDNERVEYLDGVRGWASMMVLLSHLVMGFLVIDIPELDSAAFKFITDGHLAVLIFFVISGFALSTSLFEKNYIKLRLAFFSRYLRLMVPILASSLITYTFIKLGLTKNIAVANAESASMDWLGSFYRFDPSILGLLKFSLFDVFFKFDIHNAYNATLWTMPIELFGSFFIYAFLFFSYRYNKMAWGGLIVLVIPLLITHPFWACFSLGCMLAKLRKLVPKINCLSETACIVIFILVAVVSTFFRPKNDSLTALMAVVLMVAISYSGLLRTFFSNRVSRFLGKISFPLYLLQISIICSVSSSIYLYLPKLGVNKYATALAIFIITVAVCIYMANVFTVVERLSIRISRLVASRISDLCEKKIMC